MNRILVGGILWRSSIKIAHLVPPSFGSFGQAISEEKIYFNWPIRNKNCLWRPCLLIDLNQMSHLYREHSKNASYQVSVHLAKRFQRPKLGWKYLWKVLYKYCSFRCDPLSNMATTGNSFFWLVNF
jgi:hypothetical protein